ncbi:MAG TPA: GDP-L-fucose synthase [Nitriliruptorales bacterium]|nr:GDP-L-fucose synthase [Nitriliruptorales bacterium]
MSSQVYDLSAKRVWVAGHRGLVGSALLRRLDSEPVGDILTATSQELDLRRQADTERFVASHRPDLVFLAAGRVGGIHANRSAQASFLYDNVMIVANVIEACRLHDVERVVVLGSSCIYPREAPQPIREEYLLTGPLEQTNEGYAVAKITGLKLAKMYRRQYGTDAISLMPTNLYGPNDNFDPATSHVLPALLRRIHDAKVSGDEKVTVWGTGTPRREFLHVDDLADATVFAGSCYDGEDPLNIGVGEDVSIRELVELICEVVGWDGELVFDTSMPDGTPRKLLDVSRLNALGWKPSIGLCEGLASTYRWFLQDRQAMSGSLR